MLRLELGAMPEGAQAGRIYDFTDRPSTAELARWKRIAQTEVIRLRRIENIPNPRVGRAKVTAEDPGRHAGAAAAGLPAPVAAVVAAGAGWARRFISENGGKRRDLHSKWRGEARLQSVPGVVKHETAYKFLQTMMCYDQLDVGHPASAKLIVRQIQRMGEKY